MDHPELEIVIEPLGPVRLVMPSGPNYVYVSGDATVNRVPLRYNVRLHDYGNGGFEPEKDKYGNNWNAVYASRSDGSGKDISWPTKQKIADTVAAAINAFMAENPEIRERAGESRQAADIERLEGEIAELRERLAAKGVELAALRRGEYDAS